MSLYKALLPTRYLKRSSRYLCPHDREWIFANLTPGLNIEKKIRVKAALLFKLRKLNLKLIVKLLCYELIRWKKMYKGLLATQYLQRSRSLMNPHKKSIFASLTPGLPIERWDQGESCASLRKLNWTFYLRKNQ